MIKINYITDNNIIKPILDSFIDDMDKYGDKKYSKTKNPYYENLDEQIETNISKTIKKHNKKKMISATNKIIKKMDKKLIDLKNVYVWNICITKNNFMFNCPTTLSNIIFMPYRIIQTNSYEKTLIHEKIHVFQRFKFKEWNDYILKNTNFILSKPIPVKNELYNPDTLYSFTYLYKTHKSTYRGYLNKNMEVAWINLKNDNMDILPRYEHPYECFAYEMSEEICD
jgi:hypothetical protein